MRRIQAVPDQKRRLKGAFYPGTTVRCTNLPARYRMWCASIADFHDDDMLLCCGAFDDRFTFHAVVHPTDSASEDRFTISVHAGTLGHHYRLPFSEHTELWSKVEDVRSKLTKWSEVRRIAELGPVVTDHKDTSWYSMPYSELKMTHQFFIAAVKFVKSR